MKIEMDLRKVGRLASGLQAEHAEACSRVEREEKALVGLQERLQHANRSQVVIQQLAHAVQQQAHQQISDVVTRCLRAVFDNPYEFEVQFEIKRGKTEALLVFMRDGEVLDNPINEVGGGVLDVASLALRVASILLARPERRKLIILDEPFKYVRGVGNQKRTRDMLLRLAEELEIQFVINTDIASYRLGKIVETGDVTYSEND